MSQYVALYRKFRPVTFNDVVGQDQIVKILKHQIQNNQIGHAYLFCGSRGTGKTSTAKIFSRAVNCTSPIDGEPCNECAVCKGILNSSITDVLEIDAASNNSVDNIRSIREDVIYAPTLAKYKVYIIDEVHMLSASAFNALLKTLEEPPENVIFILATTEPHKIPITILSRCQRFEFKRITKNDISKRLELICKENNVTASNAALMVIAQAAEGALRDAVSLIDQIISSGVTDITEEITRKLLGITETSVTFSTLDAILKKDINTALSTVSEIINSGKDIKYFVWEIISLARDVLVYKTTKNQLLINNYAALDKIESLTFVSNEKLSEIISYFSDLENRIKTSTFPNILLESALIQLISEPSAIPPKSTLPQKSSPQPNAVISEPLPTTPSKPKNPPLTPSKNDNNWPDVVNHLKNSGKMSLYGTLVSATAFVNADYITICLSNAFGKSVVERPENTEILKNSILAVYGKNLSVKYEIKGEQQKKEPIDELENTLINSGIDVNIT